MKAGMVKFDWNNINDLNDEDISYFLFLEGKNLKTISSIRNIELNEVQKHIIKGKIKYRFLANCNSIKDFFDTIYNENKHNKLAALNALDENKIEELIYYIRNNYVDFNIKEKEAAVWMIGELKEVSCLNILLKASVSKYVHVKRLAVSAMGKLGDLKAENALIRALDDNNPQVVTYAINSLEKIHSKSAGEKIKIISINADKDYVKRAAERYLESVDR